MVDFGFPSWEGWFTSLERTDGTQCHSSTNHNQSSKGLRSSLRIRIRKVGLYVKITAKSNFNTHSHVDDFDFSSGYKSTEWQETNDEMPTQESLPSPSQSYPGVDNSESLPSPSQSYPGVDNSSPRGSDGGDSADDLLYSQDNSQEGFTALVESNVMETRE